MIGLKTVIRYSCLIKMDNLQFLQEIDLIDLFPDQKDLLACLLRTNTLPTNFLAGAIAQLGLRTLAIFELSLLFVWVVATECLS